MHSRSMGGGRRLALAGAIVVIVGCVLPWYSVGGAAGELTARTLLAWQYPQGIATLLSALATLALIVPAVRHEPRPLAVDRGLAFAVPAIIAIVAVLAWVWAVLPAPEGLLPTARLRVLDRRGRVDHAGPRGVRDLARAPAPLGLTVPLRATGIPPSRR